MRHLRPCRSDKLRPGNELTVERVEMDARACARYSCSTEFYRARAAEARHRARFLSQKSVITVSPVMEQRHSAGHPPPSGRRDGEEG